MGVKLFSVFSMSVLLSLGLVVNAFAASESATGRDPGVVLVSAALILSVAVIVAYVVSTIKKGKNHR